MAETRNPTIERALDIAQREIGYTDAEQRAFRRFRSRIDDVDPVRSRPAPVDAAEPTAFGSLSKRSAIASRPSGTSRAQRRIIEGYRETVMETDHFATEYGNAVSDEIVLEFGEDVFHALLSEPKLTEAAYETLLDRVDFSIETRARHRRMLRQERDSLRRCDTDLTDIETTYFECEDPSAVEADDLRGIRNDLYRLEGRCQRVIDQRQDELHSRTGVDCRGSSVESFNRYLYEQQISIMCPVLYDAMVLYRDIREQRERCERRLGNLHSV